MIYVPVLTSSKIFFHHNNSNRQKLRLKFMKEDSFIRSIQFSSNIPLDDKTIKKNADNP